MAGETRASRVLILIAAVSASAAAVGVIGASCLERDVAHRSERDARLRSQRAAEAAVADDERDVPAETRGRTALPNLGWAYGDTADTRDTGANGSAGNVDGTGAPVGQTTTTSAELYDGTGPEPVGTSLAAVLDRARAQTEPPVAGHAAHADNDPNNRANGDGYEDVQNGLSRMQAPDENMSRAQDNQSRSTDADRAAQNAQAQQPEPPPRRFEGVGAGPFLTEPPIYGASSMTTDPSLGAGPFATESNLPGGIVYYGFGGDGPVAPPAGPTTVPLGGVPVTNFTSGPLSAPFGGAPAPGPASVPTPAAVPR